MRLKRKEKRYLRFKTSYERNYRIKYRKENDAIVDFFSISEKQEMLSAAASGILTILSIEYINLVTKTFIKEF